MTRPSRRRQPSSSVTASPERSSIAYDLRALTGWSSNLAANRLLRTIGGSETGGAAVAEAVNAVAGDMEASTDLHASASYRRRVAITLSKRAIEQARTDAGAGIGQGAAGAGVHPPRRRPDLHHSARP